MTANAKEERTVAAEDCDGNALLVGELPRAATLAVLSLTGGTFRALGGGG
jgi:hypothetical protein